MHGQSASEEIDDTLRAVGDRPSLSPHTTASRGLAGIFGLDARAAVLAVLVDVMVFAGDTFSLETLVPLGIVVAAGLGYIVYKVQRRYQNDEHDAALIKAMIVGILTAIPVPLTPLIAIPGGIVGMLQAIKLNSNGLGKGSKGLARPDLTVSQ